MNIKQLALDIDFAPAAVLENFYPQSNELAVAAITAMTHKTGEKFVYIWGNEGVGCTHLLQAATVASEKNNLQAIYLDMQHLLNLDPNILNGLEQLDLISIDNIDLASENKIWEQALFKLYNQVLESKSNLLVAAKLPPANLIKMLPDLRSRLAWGMVIKINELADDAKLIVLKQRFSERGLELPEEVGNYILRKCLRNMHALCRIIQQLDSASLRAKRRLTVPFVKEILGL